MTRRFSDKTVFITGASSGIGAALARAFAREGARVAMAARNEDRLREVAAGIEAEGGRALTLSCDVTDRARIDAAVAQTVETFGGIDVAVANAGFGVSGRFDSLTTDDFRRQFDTNVFGVIDTIYAVLPALKASRGRLGIVSSVLGLTGSPTTSAYCASKFALNGLAESLWYELAGDGVSVTCIMPGVVESNFRRVDRYGALHPDRPESAPSWIVVPADDAARAIVRALYRRKFDAVITGHGKAIAKIHQHFPRTVRFLAGRATRGQVDTIEARKGRD